MSKHCRVTLIEADGRLGGHSNTVDVMTANGPVPVDTGFIVYNEWNYPNLVRLFQTIGVKTEVSDMSFSASINNGSFEYSGTSFLSMIGQKTNIVRLRFWQMVGDILRFYREAADTLDAADTRTTLGSYLDKHGYSDAFARFHLLPMAAAIWSASLEDMRAHPVAAFARFFADHGLLKLVNRPAWRTVVGGSREYAGKLTARYADRIRVRCGVKTILRDAAGKIWGIDHGLTFNEYPKLRTVLWQYAGCPIAPELVSDLERIELEWAAIACLLAPHISPIELEAFRNRVNRIARSGIYPELDPRRNIPYGW